jgi:hypothetical protein
MRATRYSILLTLLFVSIFCQTPQLHAANSVYFLIRSNQTFYLKDVASKKSATAVLKNSVYQKLQTIQWSETYKTFFATTQDFQLVFFNRDQPIPQIVLTKTHEGSALAFDIYTENNVMRLAVVFALSTALDSRVQIFDITYNNQKLSLKLLLESYFTLTVEDVDFSANGDAIALTYYVLEGQDTKHIALFPLSCFEQEDCGKSLDIKDGSGERLIDPERRTLERWQKPRFSPDDKRIAFACDGICVMDMDGKNFKRYEVGAFAVEWENMQNLFYETHKTIHRLSLASGRSTLLYEFSDGTFDEVSFLTEEAVQELIALSP